MEHKQSSILYLLTAWYLVGIYETHLIRICLVLFSTLSEIFLSLRYNTKCLLWHIVETITCQIPLHDVWWENKSSRKCQQFLWILGYWKFTHTCWFSKILFQILCKIPQDRDMTCGGKIDPPPKVTTVPPNSWILRFHTTWNTLPIHNWKMTTQKIPREKNEQFLTN